MSTDMLVKLYELPEKEDLIKELKDKNIEIRRPLPPEMMVLSKWVKEKFGEHWESEFMVSFRNQPVSSFIALKDKEILGFACYNSTCKDFFGPTGVKKESRGFGIGKALLLCCLHAMKEDGYGYAVIGGAGPIDFYKKVCGAIEIADSTPGIYKGMI